MQKALFAPRSYNRASIENIFTGDSREITIQLHTIDMRVHNEIEICNATLKLLDPSNECAYTANIPASFVTFPDQDGSQEIFFKFSADNIGYKSYIAILHGKASELVGGSLLSFDERSDSKVIHRQFEFAPAESDSSRMVWREIQ